MYGACAVRADFITSRGVSAVIACNEYSSRTKNGGCYCTKMATAIAQKMANI